MIEIIGLAEKNLLREMADRITGSKVGFSDAWLKQNECLTLVAENQGHLDRSEWNKLLPIIWENPGRRWFGVTTEIRHGNHIFELEGVVDEWQFIKSEFLGIPLVIFPEDSKCAVIYTAFEYLIAAGSLEFLEDYFGDPTSARDAYERCVREYVEIWERMSPNSAGVLLETLNLPMHYFNWLDSTKGL